MFEEDRGAVFEEDRGAVFEEDCGAVFEEDRGAMFSVAVLLVLPRPFEVFVNVTAGPYRPGGRGRAVWLTTNDTVTPAESTVPVRGSAASHAGAVIENPTTPLDALTWY